MKKILCYCDSNTFGFNPEDGSRFDENTRWTAILQKNLINDYEIIEEGMCDRTGFVNNSKGFLYSSQRHFPKYLSKSDNIDILILAIGTNDFQFQYDVSFKAVERGLNNLILTAKKKAKNIIIIPPVSLKESVLNGYFKIQFNEKSIIKSRKSATGYRKTSNIFNCHFFDVNKFASPSDKDGLHYDKEAHKLIADKLSEYIRKEF